MAFLKSRVAVAIIGMLIVGGGSAGAVVLTQGASAQTRLTATALSSTSTATGAATGGQSATATTAPAPTATTPPAPTATTPRPTATPRPLPQPGQQFNPQGSVVSVNVSGNSFLLRVRGYPNPFVIDCSHNPTYSGTATSLSAIRTGWHAAVQGTYQADGSVTATAVNTQPDN